MHTVDEAAKAGANMIVSGTGVYKAATVTHLGLNCRRQGVPVASVMSGGRHGISNRHYEKKCGALWKRPLRRKSLTPKIRQGYLWMTGSAGKKGRHKEMTRCSNCPVYLQYRANAVCPDSPTSSCTTRHVAQNPSSTSPALSRLFAAQCSLPMRGHIAASSPLLLPVQSDTWVVVKLWSRFGYPKY